MASECRDCGEPLLWAVTQKGKNIPLDAEPVERGKYLLEPPELKGDKPVAVWIGEGDPYVGSRYSCHLDTCEKRR